MPYGYGGANGPAEWAAQQQAKQSDDFNQIIRLFLSLKNAQTEEGWKQKEFGANQQRDDNTLAQQALGNKQWEARFGLDKQNVETDNARQAEQARATAENNTLTREQNKWYRENTLAEQKSRDTNNAIDRAERTRLSADKPLTIKDWGKGRSDINEKFDKYESDYLTDSTIKMQTALSQIYEPEKVGPARAEMMAQIEDTKKKIAAAREKALMEHDSMFSASGVKIPVQVQSPGPTKKPTKQEIIAEGRKYGLTPIQALQEYNTMKANSGR